MSTALRDARVLVVEDEYLIADSLCRELESVGVRVVGPVPSVEGALDAVNATQALDGAILDVNLGGDYVYPVAGELALRKVPFVFWTGYDVDPLRVPNGGGAACVPKPGSAMALIDALVAERRRAGRLMLADVYVARDGDDWLLQVRAGTAPDHADGHPWLGAGLVDLHEWSTLLRVPLRLGVFYRVPVRYRLLLRARLAIVG